MFRKTPKKSLLKKLNKSNLFIENINDLPPDENLENLSPSTQLAKIREFIQFRRLKAIAQNKAKDQETRSLTGKKENRSEQTAQAKQIAIINELLYLEKNKSKNQFQVSGEAYGYLQEVALLIGDSAQQQMGLIFTKGDASLYVDDKLPLTLLDRVTFFNWLKHHPMSQSFFQMQEIIEAKKELAPLEYEVVISPGTETIKEHIGLENLKAEEEEDDDEQSFSSKEEEEDKQSLSSEEEKEDNEVALVDKKSNKILARLLKPSSIFKSPFVPLKETQEKPPKNFRPE